jgi:hypothetical protein
MARVSIMIEPEQDDNRVRPLLTAPPCPGNESYFINRWEDNMRMMIRIKIPVERGNEALKDGTLQKTIMEALERHKPEAAYFFPEHGIRTSFMVMDIKDPSEMPAIIEPFFSRLNAAVEIFPVMNAEDLKKGLSKIV